MGESIAFLTKEEGTVATEGTVGTHHFGHCGDTPLFVLCDSKTNATRSAFPFLKAFPPANLFGFDQQTLQ